jgi:hypothetical protein
MAQNYSNWTMTNQFTNAETAAATSGNQISWVRIIASSDTLQASDLPGLTDAILDTIHVNQETPISTVVVSGNTVTIAGIFSSNDNEADYYANTLLLIGSYNGQEFVAGASIATGQAMRLPAAGNENTEFTVRPQIVVSNSSTISTTVNPIAGATNERVDNEVAQLQSQIDTINDTNDTQDTTIAGKVSKTLNETVDGIKTFVKTIVGNITGNAGSATKLQTKRKINGTDFDGTADIDVNAANDDQLVHKTGNETIEGAKTFTDNLTINDGVLWANAGGNVTGYFNVRDSSGASTTQINPNGTITTKNLVVSGGTVEPQVQIQWKTPYASVANTTLTRIGNVILLDITGTQADSGGVASWSTPTGDATETIPSGFRPKRNKLVPVSLINYYVPRDGNPSLLFRANGNTRPYIATAFTGTTEIHASAIWETNDPWPS